jgi:hypothetical protein
MQKKPRWTYADSVPLPGLALDVDAKGVPEGFKFEINTKKVSSPVRGGGGIYGGGYLRGCPLKEP